MDYIEDKVQKAFMRLQSEIKHDATQWNGMLVWEATDADTLYDILRTTLAEAIAEAERRMLDRAMETAYSLEPGRFMEGSYSDGFFDAKEATHDAIAIIRSA